MKAKLNNRTLFATICILIISLSNLNSLAQKDVMELTFTASNNSYHIQLDSIKVMNRTQGTDTILYWPDTVLSLYFVGFNEISKSEDAFDVFQNYPNPVADRTIISLYVPEKDQVGLQITDPTGRVILESDRMLDKGIHSFRFTPGSGNLFFFTAQWRGKSRNIRILCTVFNSNMSSSLEYVGFENYSLPLKTFQVPQSFPFTPGDELLYIGFAASLQSGILDDPDESQIYSFQFATNIPCIGIPTIEFEGKVYNTIQIFSQCWLKENLNVGTMVLGNQDMTNNGIIEKYCYDNQEDSCTIFGGLYQWNEMMQYINQPGSQGICPPGWHIPTDEDWKVLEGAVDSQYGIGNPEWEIETWRGYDAGFNLKSTSGWQDGENGSNIFDFSGLPGGYRMEGGFIYSGSGGLWWTSNEYNALNAWSRFINNGFLIDHYYGGKKFGNSVRCLMD